MLRVGVILRAEGGEGREVGGGGEHGVIGGDGHSHISCPVPLVQDHSIQ